MKRKGISLILLVITIIVVIIISGAIILNLTNTGILDQSKKAKFMNDFTNIQEGVNLHYFSKYNATTGEFELPLKGYLTEQDKTNIKNNVPTLNTKIEELSGSISSANLAWVDHEVLDIKLEIRKQEKGYIIDVTTGQMYDYNGDYFEGKMWHTLDGGVLSDGTVGENVPDIAEELWNGWINLTLYYPAGSTEKKWRLGTEGEIRVDPMLMWQNYTGAITIPLDRIQDVWIKYILDNKEFVIPPAGTLLVDIVPDKTGTTKVDTVNVSINFDENSSTKEYRIGDSGWITYNGEFSVTENCLIEARGKKTESIYNVDGTVLSTRDIAGRDLVYIGNIGIEETQLEAPTIIRLPAVGEEKARVQVTYPASADRRIYKLNYGVEENYTTEISVTNYGTHVIAYYYDAAGKRSKASSIIINDTSTGAAAGVPGIYELQLPYEPGNPVPQYEPGTYGINIPAPTVNVNPTTISEEVSVSLNLPANADKAYIKLGRYAQYQEYTSAITIRQNMEVYAYYKTYIGEKSNIGYKVVSNIKKNNMPYVYIDANPYPWSYSYGADSVTVTISHSDTNTIEYSEDGIVYKPYTAPFTVTENKKIYARGTNAYGVTETSLDITNIGKLTPPAVTKNLAVNINANPEPLLSTNRVSAVNVSIDYDSKATQKYYSIGRYGQLQEYTGNFEVTSNCTIYAYAKGINSQGQAAKTIDNLYSGISQPIITAIPNSSEQASKVSISIEYDKYSVIKKYSIDGTPLREYTGAFEVNKNGTVIYAYSENDLGQKSDANYTVENIAADPPILVLDKGQYYILKLNYPETSKNREYKWKQNGEWKEYKEAGILLLKPQFRQQLIQNGELVKIEDETGDLVTFTGDYYFIDVPISEMFENLFMRWDREPLNAPQILITPIEPSIQVSATIVYNDALVKKQYKLIKSGEISSTWIEYTGPITIDRNNTVIYAKGMDETEVWTAESIKKVTNIDEIQPVINLTADLIETMQKVGVRVSITDDVEVGKIKWASGIQGESYFANSGTEILNDSIVNITSNGYYTFYAEDKVGNKQVYTLNVTNVDLTPPVIDIQIIPESAVGITANVTINYGDSTIKQYKVGESNAVWSNYTTTFEISSYTILSNNLQNTDGTVTIYAKGKDSSGNEITIQKKAVSLDLNKPIAPVINSNSSYATLTTYGAKFDAATTIKYDSRTDIDNYYSIDNGVTWLLYSGQFDMSNGTVIAKSVKRYSGLETIISQTISMPTDSLKSQAYDGNDTTYVTNVTNQYMQVDSNMQKSNFRVKWSSMQGATISLNFLDENKALISKVSRSAYDSTIFDDIYNIPLNTKWIKYESYNAYDYCKLYEIGISNEPTFSATNGYMLLAADKSKVSTEPYQMVTISYFPTSTQRMYKIGTTGEWLNYLDQPVKVSQGLTIYAKGIDIYGNESRILTSYTANVQDSFKKEIYDGNDTTYVTNVTNQYMQVDSSIQGKNIRMKWSIMQGATMSLNFLDENKVLISSVSRTAYNDTTYDDIYNVPLNTKWIRYEGYAYYNYCKLYEIGISNEPTFTATNGYMKLSLDLSKTIKEPYQMVNISYFPTSVQMLYRIGTAGDWLNYTGGPVNVNQGSTIYAKGIDVYGNETRIVSSYTSNVPDSLKKEIYDGNDSTYITNVTNQYMQVDSNMQGKNIRVKWSAMQGATLSLVFLDENKNIISNVSRSGYGETFDTIYNIPLNTKWIRYESYSAYDYCKFYEISPSI